jgi:hypothetical protein
LWFPFTFLQYKALALRSGQLIHQGGNLYVQLAGIPENTDGMVGICREFSAKKEKGG